MTHVHQYKFVEFYWIILMFGDDQAKVIKQMAIVLLKFIKDFHM
jgi:hypothetical protein